MATNSTLDTDQQIELLDTLHRRFEEATTRHPGISWGDVQKKLKANPERLWSIAEMERTGGQPDVVGDATADGEYLYVDCSPESPEGRRSTCYDDEGLASRKKNKPAASALGMATEMGVEILTEDQYRLLQDYGQFDARTSSWIRTPGEIRSLGGALFADYRYESVFVYHNGAESYYGARGFRASLTV